MNKPVQKRVFKSDAQKWDELITELQELAVLAEPGEYRVAMCMPKVGALNLVQPWIRAKLKSTRFDCATLIG